MWACVACPAACQERPGSSQDLSWWDPNTCNFVGKWSLERTFMSALKICLKSSKLEQFETVNNRENG